VRDASWWAALACLLAFALLGLAVPDQGPIAFDAPVTAFVQGLPVPTDIWLVFTAAGGTVLLPIGIAVVVGLTLRDSTRSAIVYGVALLGASLWTYLVKIAVARERPAGASERLGSGFSYPSGHTLNSTVTYGLIALLVWRSGWPLRGRRAAVVALGVLIVLIGLSRIAIGVHYPTDVVGGWLGGIAVVSIVAATSRTAADSVSEQDERPADDATAGPATRPPDGASATVTDLGRDPVQGSGRPTSSRTTSIPWPAHASSRPARPVAAAATTCRSSSKSRVSRSRSRPSSPMMSRCIVAEGRSPG
jgi:membrane-associated phospholipid phosphatase